MDSLSHQQLPRSESLRDRALEVIRQAIVSGEVHPGEIYSAAALAARLGVSGSPVREAMLTLGNKGIMEPVRNRGFRVIPLTSHDLDEVYQLRWLLEVPTVTKLAHTDLTPWAEQLTQHTDAIEEAAQAGHVQQFLEADREFHLTLLGLSGNRRLVETVATLRDQTRLYGLETLAARGLLNDSAAEHRRILETLTAGDATTTQDLMTRHLAHIQAEWSAPS